jgi:GMP reductase
MASNMDTIGTFEMAIELSKQSVFTAIHKHYTLEDWISFQHRNPEGFTHISVSTGISEADSTKLNQILSEIPKIKYICIDVANGYSEAFVEFVKRTHQTYPTKTIIVSFECCLNMTPITHGNFFDQGWKCGHG